ncbi:MAG: glutamate racemase [Bacteroidales bacterium]|nr:glutamate racemase [Bacteroidales bacterium]
MNIQSDQPIGIFDSGVGGLTVAHAIKQLLPNEDLIYFGDTAHLPYGDKSRESIIHYSTEITKFLLKINCKVILMACNSASAVAYNELQEQFGNTTIVINVIDPVVNYLKNNYSAARVGVIGTKATINSGTYKSRISDICTDIDVVSLATPLFVPMIEEGFIFDDISNAIIRAYLSNEQLNNIDALILGCTHYPIIKNQISKFFNFDVEILDSARIVANELRKLLEEKQLLNSQPLSKYEFFVSDYTDHFEKISKMFFEEQIKMIKSDLWK